MKKTGVCCTAVLLCMALSAVALAADVVCVQERALGAEYEYNIMQATLDNGQVLYYLSMEDSAWFQMEDVNFDGHEDFVPTTTRGASNFFSSFYLFNPQSGQYESVFTGDQGLCNYTLMPEKGYVVSSVRDGWRDGDTKIYQWQGGTLQLLRRATVKSLSTVEFGDAEMTERWDFGQYEMFIYDYTTGEEGGRRIYQEIYPDDDPQIDEHMALFDERLWEGL